MTLHFIETYELANVVFGGKTLLVRGCFEKKEGVICILSYLSRTRSFLGTSCNCIADGITLF